MTEQRCAITLELITFGLRLSSPQQQWKKDTTFVQNWWGILKELSVEEQWYFSGGYTLYCEEQWYFSGGLFLHSESYAVYFPTWTMRKMSTCMFDTASPRATYTEFVNTTMVNQFLAILKREKLPRTKLEVAIKCKYFLSTSGTPDNRSYLVFDLHALKIFRELSVEEQWHSSGGSTPYYEG